MTILAEKNQKEGRFNPELSSILLLEQANNTNNYSLIDQVIDEETTRFAEIIDGPIRTEFEFNRTESGLVSKGDSKLLDLWKNSYELTKSKINTDNRQKKLLEIRESEYLEGLDVEDLAKYGQTGDGFLVISAYPEEIEFAHGKKFVKEEGFDHKRRLAFIRQYKKVGDSVVLTTASVDNSHLALWSKIVGKNIETSNQLLRMRFNCSSDNLDSLVFNYDSLLNTKTGSRHHQGRDDSKNEETYLFVSNQKDLMDYNYSRLSTIALSDMDYNEKLNQKINLTKQVASALIYRYENKNTTKVGSLESEIINASYRASSEGREFISCGGYLSVAEDSLLRTVTRTNDSMKCVTCPFCKKTVDAVVKRSSIACPECRVEVNTNNNKVTHNNRPKNSFTKIVEKILEDLFRTAKN